MLYRFAAKKGFDFSKVISRIGSVCFLSWRKNKYRKEKLIASNNRVASTEGPEKFSAMRFEPNIKNRIAPKNREAPVKSMFCLKCVSESSSKIIIRTIRPIPMGRLI